MASTLRTRFQAGNIRKRKRNDEEKYSLSPNKKIDSENVNIPDQIVHIVKKESFINTSLIVESGDITSIEEIEPDEKVNLAFQIMKIECFADEDLAILRIKDGTICPLSTLCFPSLPSWKKIKSCIEQNPQYKMQEPVVDILLYNCSNCICMLKELLYYTMKNINVVKTKVKSGILLSADGKEAYVTKIRTANKIMSDIMKRTNYKKFQLLEEKYLQSLNQSKKISLDEPTNNLLNKSSTSKDSTPNKITESNKTPDLKKGESADKQKLETSLDSNCQQKPIYTTLSTVKEELSINTIGIIENILIEEDKRKFSKLRITIDVIDHTKETPPLKVDIFLAQEHMRAVRKIMQKHHIIEITDMKVRKICGVLRGNIFKTSSIQLYNLATSKHIQWLESSNFKPSEPVLKLVKTLSNWFENKGLNSSKNSEAIHNSRSEAIHNSRSEAIHNSRSKTSKTSENVKHAVDTPEPKKTRNIFNILDGIVTRAQVDTIKYQCSSKDITDLEDLKTAEKFTALFQVIKIHNYSEFNLDVIEVKGNTLLSLPTLQIPLKNSWLQSKNSILDKPSFSREDENLSLLCIESNPHLPPLKIGAIYKFHSVLLLKTHLCSRLSKKVGYVLCVESKDSEISVCNRKKSGFSIDTDSRSSIKEKELKEDIDKTNSSTYEEKKAVLSLSGDSLHQDIRLCLSESPEKDNELQSKSKTSKSDTDATVSSLVGWNPNSDNIIPENILREINSILEESKCHDLPAALSEDAHLINSGSDPTYSEFVKHAKERNKMSKTSTQADIVCSPSYDVSLLNKDIDCTPRKITESLNNVECNDILNLSDSSSQQSKSILNQFNNSLINDNGKEEGKTVQEEITLIEGVAETKINGCRLLIDAVLKDNFKIPSSYFLKSSYQDKSLVEKESGIVPSSLPSAADSFHYVTVTNYPNLPLCSIKTLLHVRETNCHSYTAIPVNLKPQLKDNWGEQSLKCICNGCNQRFSLGQLKKITSLNNNEWPGRDVPICQNCKEPCIKFDTLYFHFEMQLKLINLRVTCTAILESKCAESFLDCSAQDFYSTINKRTEVQSRLEDLFPQNKAPDVYSFTLKRLDFFDPKSGPLYITNIKKKPL